MLTTNTYFFQMFVRYSFVYSYDVFNRFELEYLVPVYIKQNVDSCSISRNI